MPIVESSHAFLLKLYQDRQPMNTGAAVAIVPKDLTKEDVTLIWTNAVRHTAAGLDIPDYDKAIEALLEQHPDWVISRSGIESAPVDLSKS